MYILILLLNQKTNNFDLDLANKSSFLQLLFLIPLE